MTDRIVYEIHSFIRGYHAYMDVWEYEVGKTLQLRREVDNEIDAYAVAVVQEDLEEDRVVGHVPFNFAKPISLFLQRELNDGRVEVTREKINRGAGYGLELPCVYRLYGPKLYVNKLKELIEALKLKKLL